MFVIHSFSLHDLTFIILVWLNIFIIFCCFLPHTCTFTLLLFFLFYINDLPETIKDTSLPTLFADAVNLICVQRSLEGLKDDFASVLTKVNRWFQSNSLTLNLNKTNLVHFTAKLTTNIPDCIKLGQNRLINSQTINFLGLTLDYTLSWRPHIAGIGNKL